MKLKKIISLFATVSIMSSMAFTTVNASSYDAITYDESEGVYWIENDAMSTTKARTPYIETAVKALTSDEVVDLSSANTSLSGLKLKADEGKYGDTKSFTVYEVTGTVKDVGRLAFGYKRDENVGSIRLQSINAWIDLPVTQGEIEAVGYKKDVNKLTNTAWDGPSVKVSSLINSKDGFLIKQSLGTSGAIPKSEGVVEAADYVFTAYFVMKAGHSPLTLNYRTAASVNYNVNGNIAECLIGGDKSESFTLGTSAPDPKPVTAITVQAEDMVVGETDQIPVVTVTPTDADDTTYTLSSSNTAVATIVEGKIHAVGAGTTTITATANDGSGVTGTATITVSKPAPQFVIDAQTGVSSDKKAKAWGLTIKNFDSTKSYTAKFTKNGETKIKNMPFDSAITGSGDIKRIIIIESFAGDADQITFAAECN